VCSAGMWFREGCAWISAIFAFCSWPSPFGTFSDFEFLLNSFVIQIISCVVGNAEVEFSLAGCPRKLREQFNRSVKSSSGYCRLCEAVGL
jgi:hypothetical protein